MQEGAQWPASVESPPPPAAEVPTAARVRGLWRALGHGPRWLRRGFEHYLGWPRGHLPVPTVTSLLLAAILIVVTVELLPRSLSDVTLSVRARTEIIELELHPLREYTWWLPAGSYSLLTGKVVDGCTTRDRFDVVCTYGEQTALTMKHGATVRLETIPVDRATTGARFSVAVTPRRPSAGKSTTESSAFEIRNDADQILVETGELVTFESGPVDLWRIPLILKRVQVGESLAESIAAKDTLGAVRQPIMTEGDVRIFARGFAMSDRYQIQEERFDPADVVQIPAERNRDGLLLGLISLAAEDARGFELTLHTDLAEIFVRRLGAEHLVGVSMWSIVSQLPLWAALWVVWVSLIVVGNYHAARLQVRGQSHDTTKH